MPSCQTTPSFHPDLCCIEAADALILCSILGLGTNVHAMHMDKNSRVVKDAVCPSTGMYVNTLPDCVCGIADTIFFSWRSACILFIDFVRPKRHWRQPNNSRRLHQDIFELDWPARH
jgi:hypothetical protein